MVRERYSGIFWVPRGALLTESSLAPAQQPGPSLDFQVCVAEARSGRSALEHAFPGEAQAEQPAATLAAAAAILRISPGIDALPVAARLPGLAIDLAHALLALGAGGAGLAAGSAVGRVGAHVYALAVALHFLRRARAHAFAGLALGASAARRLARDAARPAIVGIRVEVGAAAAATLGRGLAVFHAHARAADLLARATFSAAAAVLGVALSIHAELPARRVPGIASVRAARSGARGLAVDWRAASAAASAAVFRIRAHVQAGTAAVHEAGVAGDPADPGAAHRVPAGHSGTRSLASSAVIRIRRDVDAAAAASALARRAIQGAAAVGAQLATLAADAAAAAVGAVALDVYASLAARLEARATGESAHAVFAGGLTVRGRVTTQTAFPAVPGRGREIDANVPAGHLPHVALQLRRSAIARFDRRRGVASSRCRGIGASRRDTATRSRLRGSPCRLERAVAAVRSRSRTTAARSTGRGRATAGSATRAAGRGAR